MSAAINETSGGADNLVLTARGDAFVVRATKEEIAKLGLTVLQVLSERSCAVQTRTDRYAADMELARKVAAAYPLYEQKTFLFPISYQLIVRTCVDIAREQQNAQWKSYGVKKIHAWSNREFLLEIQGRRRDPAKVASELRQEGDVVSVEYVLDLPPIKRTPHDRRILDLTLDQNMFISRATKEELKRNHFSIMQVLSVHSFAVRTTPDLLAANLVRARRLAPAHPFYMQKNATVPLTSTFEEPFLVSPRLVVRTRMPLAEELREPVWERYGAAERDAYSDREFLLQIEERDPVDVAMELFEAEGSIIDFVEHDLNHRLRAAHLADPPTHPHFHAQWYLQGNGSIGAERRASIDAVEAWELLHGFGSKDVVIGLPDDGCDMEHPAFGCAKEKFPFWAYFTADEFRTSRNGGDRGVMMRGNIDHGTACAGVIAGAVVTDFPVGVAPNCRIAPVKFDRTSHGKLMIPTHVLREAFRFLADKVDVICCPWGESPVSLWGTALREEIARLARDGGRRGKGIVFVWPAGNVNAPLLFEHDLDNKAMKCMDPSHRREPPREMPSYLDDGIPFTNGRNAFGEFRPPERAAKFMNDLVGLPGVIHVGGVASNTQRSHYSNYGRGLTLCAPSTNLQTYGGGDLLGKPIKALGAKGVAVTPTFGGTSASAAIVAGVAALVISANPDLTAEQVLWILKTTADRNLEMKPYDRSIAERCGGIPNTWDISPVPPYNCGHFRENGDPDGSWSPWFGYGKVNARRAVQKALEMQRKSERARSAKEPSPKSPEPAPAPAQQMPIASHTHSPAGAPSQSKPS